MLKPVHQNCGVQIFCIFPFWQRVEAVGLSCSERSRSRSRHGLCEVLFPTLCHRPMSQRELGIKEMVWQLRRNSCNSSSPWLAFPKHHKVYLWLWTTLPKNPSFLSHLFPSPSLSSQLLEKHVLLNSSPRSGPCSPSYGRRNLGNTTSLMGRGRGAFEHMLTLIVDVLSQELFPLLSGRNWGRPWITCPRSYNWFEGNHHCIPPWTSRELPWTSETDTV